MAWQFSAFSAHTPGWLGLGRGKRLPTEPLSHPGVSGRWPVLIEQSAADAESTAERA